MALFGKKETSDDRAADESAAGGEDRADGLEQVTQQLGQLGQLLSDANQTVAAYLVQRESRWADHDEQFAGALGAEFNRLAEKLAGAVRGGPSETTAEMPAAADAGQMGTLIQPLTEKLDQLDSKLQGLAEVTDAGRVAAEKTASAGPELLRAVSQQSQSLAGAIRQLQGQVESGLAQVVQLVQPPEEDEDQDSRPAGSADWQQAVLGPELAEDPALAFQRQQLIDGVLEGQPAACGLAGQLLVFQSAPPERMPQLLKDLGEAFYRWQPKTAPGTNPMEEALVQWLHGRCEAAGIYNTIELVHPGERFDSARHNASSRGVEITEVHGWIVLRDNGRVYMKASVGVR